MGRNQHWINLNELRAYPVDETSSSRDDDGWELPSSFLADLRIVYPREYGEHPFVGAVSSTTGAVTVLIQAATTRSNSGGEHTLLASLTVAKRSLQQNRIYNLRPVVDGVSGFVVFGSGADLEFQLKFSSAEQSGLCQRSFHAARSMPLSNVRLHGLDDGLSGVVNLLTEPPFELVKETHEILGIDRECIVLRMVEDSTADEESVFLRYAGPCGRRPDSRTCLDPQPVEKIGAVPPDCDGQIVIELQGALEARSTDDIHRVVLDTPASLDRTCRPPYIPDIHGNFPGEYDPYAGDSESDSTSP